MICKNNIQLLEQYFYGKDNNIPSVIESIFAEDSRVTFSIETDVISFPDDLHGASAISEHMFASFHDSFEQIKSYYVLNSPQQKANISRGSMINDLNWLVTMRERESGMVRVGTGHYDWITVSDGERSQIVSLHVLIKTMQVFDEPKNGWLQDLQSMLISSWASYDDVLQVCGTCDELIEVKEYLTLAARRALVA